MNLSPLQDQENVGFVSCDNKENVVSITKELRNKRQRPVFGVLDTKQFSNKRQKEQFSKQVPSKSKPQETSTFFVPTKSSTPFVIYEDVSIDFKETKDNFSEKDVENHNSLILKNEEKAPVPEKKFKEITPVSYVDQIIQPNIVQINEKDNIEEKYEVSDSSSLYSPKLIDHYSLTEHKLRSNIDTYTCEFYSYLRNVEKLHRPNTECIRRLQPNITNKMRATLVGWMVEVAQEYKLQNETLHLAVSFIDRFLSLMPVVRSELQLLGTAAMYVASKYEEIYIQDVHEFVYITDYTYTKQQVLKNEQLILKVLGFNVSYPTTIIFLKHICVNSNVPLKVMYLAMYLTELSLLEPDPYLSYTPSMTASGCIALARLILECEDLWPEEMSDITKYSLNDLIPILKYLNQTYNVEQHTPHPTAIKLKYKCPRYSSVSDIDYKDLVIPEEIIVKTINGIAP